MLDPISSVEAGIIYSAFVFGLFSSIHCFTMCGAISCQASSSKKGIILYQSGRLISYLSMGFIVFFLAKTLFLSVSEKVHYYSLYFIGITYLLIAIGIFLKKRSGFSKNNWLGKIYRLCFKRITHLQGQKSFSFLLGLISGLLPCGLLHTFLIGVVPLESPLVAGLYVASFWAATLPGLSLGGWSFQKLQKKMADKAPALQGLSFLVLGIYIVYVKHQSMVELGICQ